MLSTPALKNAYISWNSLCFEDGQKYNRYNDRLLTIQILTKQSPRFKGDYRGKSSVSFSCRIAMTEDVDGDVQSSRRSSNN